MRGADHAEGRWGLDSQRSITKHNLSRLVALLQPLRVSIVLLEPDQTTAQGEWNYRRRESRIHPLVLKAGLKAFSQTLHHEVLHVTQSCSVGGVTRPPEVISFDSPPSHRVNAILRRPPYAGLSQGVLDLEREAFEQQDQSALVRELLKQFCLP